MVANTCCRIEELSKVKKMLVSCMVVYLCRTQFCSLALRITFSHQFPKEKESLFHPNARFEVGTVFSETLLSMIESKVIPECNILGMGYVCQVVV